MDNQNNKKVYLAGGCFWGVEEYFRRMRGVIFTRVGYANGNTADTSYRELNRTGHAETVEVVYDPEIVSLRAILKAYFSIIDPTSINRQGADIGVQYRTGIYYLNNCDRDIIEQIMQEVQGRYLRPLAVECELLDNFIEAEDYHQRYLVKNPDGYCHIAIPPNI